VLLNCLQLVLRLPSVAGGACDHISHVGKETSMPEVIAIGETMLLAVPPRPDRLRHSPSVLLKMGGAESNVAIGLARLGITSAWGGLLGNDEPGQLVLDRIRVEGVDTTAVRRVPDAPTDCTCASR
jgi:2-dehydro-3-deoxygluconokinase